MKENDELFEEMRNALLVLDSQVSSANVQHDETHHKTDLKNNLEDLENELSFVKNLNEDRKKRIHQLQEQLQTQKRETIENHRKQTKKYIEIFNEKNAQLQKNRRTISSLKQKLDSLTEEIGEIRSSKSALDNVMHFSMENMTTTLKEFNNIIDYCQLDKVALESKYRTLNEKVDHMVKVNLDLERRKNRLEESYQKLKLNHNKSLSQNIDLQFQIAKFKNQIKMVKTQGQAFQQRQEGQQTKQLEEKVQEVLKLFKKNQNRWQKLDKLKQLDQFYSYFTNDNSRLKNQISDRQRTIQKLRKRNSSQVKAERNPSLIDQIYIRCSRIEEYQKRISEIEQFIKKKEEQIESIIVGTPQKDSKLRQIKEEVLSLQKKCEDLKIQKDQLDKKCRTYKLQLHQMIQKYENGQGIKKKNKIRKSRCEVCFLGSEEGTLQRCPQCKKNLHKKSCMDNHECLGNELNADFPQNSFDSNCEF